MDGLLQTMRNQLVDEILARWYPLVVDREHGGYFTNVSRDWQIMPDQEKMIVSQARHIWTLSKAAEFVDEKRGYADMARHGFRFLRDTMWDHTHGGFYQIRSRNGGTSDVNGWMDEKRTYGNAFAIYGLAALYKCSGDEEVLELAKKTFRWVEEHAFDPSQSGYFQFLTHEGNPFDASSGHICDAGDKNELGFKDQNSSIHLLEAYTELYNVWKDPFLAEQLKGLLRLIRDSMVDEKGFLHLFFHRDITPVSFRNASAEDRRQNIGLDHVSFGHDYETAFLMLEASHALGMESDEETLVVARRMLDHALSYGWDRRKGGFYDAGYYFTGQDTCSIVKDTKNWWAQAEALNALLLFSKIFPDSGYLSYFKREWSYVWQYVLDHERGDWFEGGLDREPFFIDGPKSHMWKCTYHTSRALMNCIAMQANGFEESPGIRAAQQSMNRLINHWKECYEDSPGTF